jgi:hypothetical protein
MLVILRRPHGMFFWVAFSGSVVLLTSITDSRPAKDAASRILYVAANGFDSNDGSASNPWLTLQKAANSVRPGDTVRVQAGNYRGFNIVVNGTSSAPITFKAEKGAVIDTGMTWGGITFGINASGRSYNIIDGFTVQPARGEPNWLCGIRMGGIPPGGAVPQWATGNTIRNCTVTMRAPAVGSSSRNYDQMPLFSSWQDGILVEKCIASGGWDSGIYVSNSAKNYIVRGNTVFNCGGNGIHNNGDASQGRPGINTNALIESNIVHDVGFGMGGQAISCDGLQKSIIRNNLIYRAYVKGISLYVANAAGPSINNKIVNNTVIVGVNTSRSVVYVPMRIPGGNNGNVLYNNIFLNAIAGQFAYDVESDATIDYNVISNPPQHGLSLALWQAMTGGGYGHDIHSVAATPAQVFVNPSGNDYHLKSGSPAIDAGTPTHAPSTDIKGTARPQGAGYDMGAYEHN